jgi:uncharacterized protein YcnI
MSRSLPAAAAAAALLFALPAFAHVELETDRAPAGSSFKAVLMVPHGCAGSPTVAIKVQIPAGVVHAQPMPKPGWTLTTVVKKLDQPVKYYDTTLTEDVREIEWSGGSLPDAWYDEFVFVAHLPDRPGEVVRFPTVQQCANGVHRWIEIPAQGQDAEELKEPAPAVTLGPKAAGGD